MEDERKNLVAEKKWMEEKEKHSVNEGRLLMSLVKRTSKLPRIGGGDQQEKSQDLSLAYKRGRP
jgi:hypothetical protein